MFNLVVLIDLKKALFDTVDHQILLSKLELYGIKGQGRRSWGGGTPPPPFFDWEGRISNCPPPFFHMSNEI